MKRIDVPPLGRLARSADRLMHPLMRLMSSAPDEAPMRTHRWNNMKLTSEDVAHLSREDMVHCKGIGESMRRINPVYHLPLFGGWRDYVVLKPTEPLATWCVGWMAGDVIGVSRIRAAGPVRTLIGPGDVSFFGVSVWDGMQVPICEVARGRIGDGGPHSQVLLL